jgi:hypothetical protein
MVGINIILSFGKEYVKLVWEFTGKQARAGELGFLTFEEN